MVETNVHFPADTSQLYDAMRKVLEVCATLSALQGSTQWRQFSHNLRGIKRLLRVVHKLKRSTSKKPEKKAQKDQKIKQAHREYLAAANYQLQRAMSTGAEFGGINPLLFSKLNHYVAFVVGCSTKKLYPIPKKCFPFSSHTPNGSVKEKLGCRLSWD